MDGPQRTGEAVKVIVLGCGTSTGVPSIGCRCTVCTSGHPRNRRLRASIWLGWEGRGILVDTTTDLRQQALERQIPRVDAVLYTHPHADHIHGIDELRIYNSLQGGVISCFGSRQTVSRLRQSFRYIFEEDGSEMFRPKLTVQVIQGPFRLFDQEVVPLPADHGPGGKVLGFRFGPFAYLTDCVQIPEETLARMEGLTVLILDALRQAPHPSHLTLEEASRVALRLGAARTYLTHLSHDVDYEAANAFLPEGVELAYDGLEFEV